MPKEPAVTLPLSTGCQHVIIYSKHKPGLLWVTSVHWLPRAWLEPAAEQGSEPPKSCSSSGPEQGWTQPPLPETSSSLKGERARAEPVKPLVGHNSPLPRSQQLKVVILEPLWLLLPEPLCPRASPEPGASVRLGFHMQHCAVTWP